MSTQATIEHWEQLAQDTKKAFSYDKHAGKWSWFDRADAEDTSLWHGGYDSRLDALRDAIESYLDENCEGR